MRVKKAGRVLPHCVLLSVGRRLLRGTGRASGSREEGACLVRGGRVWILLDDAVPRVARTRLILQLPVTQTDLEQRLRDLRALRIDIDDLRECRQCTRIIPLAIMGLADPVLGVRCESILREPLGELAECEDGALVLIRLKAR